jgi:hypothetical protein
MSNRRMRKIISIGTVGADDNHFLWRIGNVDSNESEEGQWGTGKQCAMLVK